MSSGDVLRGATFNLKRFAAVLPALREAFDFMIVDAPPVGHNFDVLMLSLHLDSVILVAEANRTRFQEMREAFDFMIVDAPPVGHNFDVLMLSLHLDSVILVAEANRTHFQEVREALKELKRAGTNLLGIVLNRQKDDMQRAMQNWL
jgi:Mrp family chromosome partitioning ATPase